MGKQITINAAVNDAIGRYIHSFKWEKEIPNKTHSIDYYFDELSIENLKFILSDETVINHEIVNKDHYCSDCGGRTETYLKATYNYTEQEKASDLEHCIKYRKAAVQFIQRYIDKSKENKEQVIAWLEYKGLEINGLIL